MTFFRALIQLKKPDSFKLNFLDRHVSGGASLPLKRSLHKPKFTSHEHIYFLFLMSPLLLILAVITYRHNRNPRGCFTRGKTQRKLLMLAGVFSDSLQNRRYFLRFSGEGQARDQRAVRDTRDGRGGFAFASRLPSLACKTQKI